MGTPILLPVADFAPDLPPNNASGFSANIVNAFPRSRESYGPVNSLSPYTSNSTAGTCLGAIAVPDSAGNNYVFAGDGTALYQIVPGSAAFASLNTGYSVPNGEFWYFTQFGNRVVAVAQGQAPQSFVLGSSLSFAPLAGSPPQARYCAIIKDWLMLGNTFDAVNGAQPQRVQWCAIDDPTTWPAAGSVLEAQLLAGSQIVPGDQGWIQGVVGNLGTSDGAVFFERAIWRVVFSGSPTIFSFYPCEGVRGTPSPKSVAQLGSLVFYLGEDGFYSFDGSNSVPIGIDRVDRTFFATVNPGFMYNVISAVDPINKLILWLYPSSNSSSGLPDSLLVFSPVLNKWGSASVSASYIFRSISQGYSLEGLDSVPPVGDLDTLPYSLDSREWTGGQISIGAFTTLNKLAFFTGPTLAATLDTCEIEPFADAGKNAWVDDSMPLIDGGSPTVQLGTRQSMSATASYGNAVSLDFEGKCPQRADSRLVRARVQTQAGQNWNHFKGVRAYVTPSGER